MNPDKMQTAMAIASTIQSRKWDDDVAIGYLHPNGEVSSNFSKSLLALQAVDLRGGFREDGTRVGGHGHFGFHLPLESGANIVTARNMVVREFLKTRADWLWMLDADMAFEADTLERLLEDADPETRPIVGGLCFARLGGEAQEIVPTCYSFNGAGEMVRWNGYPENQLFQVGGTGAACLLVHRRVFQTILDATVDERIHQLTGTPVGTRRYAPPWPWFAETVYGSDWGQSMSEDLTFCLRAGSLGFPIFVDSRIKIGHQKPLVITEDTYRHNLPQAEPPAPTYVVIPVRGRKDLTDQIVRALVTQDEFDHLFIYDNAAGTPDALEMEPNPFMGVQVIPAEGLGIHEMWNLGIKEAINRSPRCNIAVLNNDLVELSDHFLDELAAGLRAHPGIAAVCPRYDGRQMVEKVQAVKGICAGRYDGSGGFAGFAFMARGELWSGDVIPYFDEELRYWWGDNAFLLELDKIGATYGMVRDATCVHLDGQTDAEHLDETEPLKNADRETFRRKYGNPGA